MNLRLLVFFFLQLILLTAGAQPAKDDEVIKEIKRLYDQGGSLINSQQPDSAVVVLKYTLAYAKQALGEDHFLGGDIAHTLGYVCMELKHQAEAKSYYLESLHIKQLIYVPPHASLAFTFNELGIIYEIEDSFKLAESHYIEARTNWAGSFGREHLRYSWAQHNLGKLYNRLGRNQEAVECLTEALRVKLANLPVDDPDIGQTLVILSGAYFQLGDFAGYEATALRAAEIWKKQKGTNDLLYYWSRHTLALLQERLGNYDMALTLASEALEGKTSIYGPYHLDVASTLTLIATVFSGKLQYDSANNYLRQAKEIYEMHQFHSIEYGWVLNNLGQNASFQGDYDQALDYLGSALKIKESLIGTENTDYSSTLLNYTMALIHKDQLDTALLLLEQQKLFYEQRDMTLNENYITCLNLLSHVQVKQSNSETALHTIQLINHLYRSSIPLFSGFASETELFANLQTAEYYLHKYLSLAFHSEQINETDQANVSDQLLFFKGFLLDKYTEIRNQVQWDTASLRLYHDLNAQKKLLTKELVKIPSERQDTKWIEDKIASLEKDLSHNIPAPTGITAETTSIRNALKSKEVAIEFAAYRYFMPEYRDSIFYCAILIHPSLSSPVLIPLFESRQLAYYVTDTVKNRSDFANMLYLKDNYALYDLIWAPLVPYLSKTETIYFSASGLLHLINFNAIPTSRNAILGDEFDLIQVITTSQLLTRKTQFNTSTECTLIGGIYYEVDTTSGNSMPTEIQELPQDGIAYTTLPNMDRSLRGKTWTYLKGSDLEVDQIFPLFRHAGLDAGIWKGHAATEEKFKSLSRSVSRANSPRIIHLSTHGYFFPDPVQNASLGLTGGETHLIKSADNPLIRSGLILAGGNYAWQYGKSFRPWMEDGILTAYEIVPMDLSSTELVVLSACESGLGDIHGNEGVYGLQRALKIAGVQYIIMSLWQVPDAATVELMTRFYTQLLKHNQPVRKSLWMAQKEMRSEGYDPFEWAGFILIE